MPGASQDPATSDGQWDNQWVAGLVSPVVSTVTVLNTDCSKEQLSIANGTFFYVVPPTALEAGIVPYELAALDRSGREVFSKVISLAPPATPQTPEPAAPGLSADCLG